MRPSSCAEQLWRGHKDREHSCQSLPAGHAGDASDEREGEKTVRETVKLGVTMFLATAGGLVLGEAIKRYASGWVVLPIAAAVMIWLVWVMIQMIRRERKMRRIEREVEEAYNEFLEDERKFAGIVIDEVFAGDREE